MNSVRTIAVGKTSLPLLSIVLLCLFVGCAGLKSKTAVEDEFDRGLSLFNRGNYEAAIPHFEKATALDPDFGRAYLYLGRSYLNLGKWKEAIPCLRAAYRFAPEDTRREIADIVLDLVLEQITRMEDLLPDVRPDTDTKGGDSR